MADLVITAANVASNTGARIDRSGVAGATITAGQTVYQDPSDSKWKLADTDSGTTAVRAVSGIALNAALAGQPLAVHVEGPITVGAALSPGVAYYLSKNAGGICPVADLTTGCYPTFLGMATSASVLDVHIHPSGVALP